MTSYPSYSGSADYSLQVSVLFTLPEDKTVWPMVTYRLQVAKPNHLNGESWNLNTSSTASIDTLYRIIRKACQYSHYFYYFCGYWMSKNFVNIDKYFLTLYDCDELKYVYKVYKCYYNSKNTFRKVKFLQVYFEVVIIQL